MELSLSKIDLFQVGSTSKNTLKVLPAEDGAKQQKVVVGDETGAVTCIGLKKEEVQVRTTERSYYAADIAHR